MHNLKIGCQYRHIFLHKPKFWKISQVIFLQKDIEICWKIVNLSWPIFDFEVRFSKIGFLENYACISMKVLTFFPFIFQVTWPLERGRNTKPEFSIYEYSNITHSKEFSGNQGKHQNFDPSILPYKFGLIFMGMKQKKFFFFRKKNSKWPTQINWDFQNRQFSKNFC